MRILISAILLAFIPFIARCQTAPSARDPQAQLEAALGPMMPGLCMAASMDQAPNGSIIYSRDPGPSGGIFMEARYRKDSGRQCADLSDKFSFLSIHGGEGLGTKYTLAIWVKLPFATKDATVWSGFHSTPLFVRNGQFMCSVEQTDHVLAAYDNTLRGWHHLALIGDGETTSLAIDGVVRGFASVPVEANFDQVGGRMFGINSLPTQCGLIDDMLIFDRALTQEELTKLQLVRLPVQPPPAVQIDTRSPSYMPEPISSSGQETARELVKLYSNSLVFITGQGAGSGFLADMGGKPFLLTNAHVAAGVRNPEYRTLRGTTLTPSTPSVAVGHDLFAMPAPGATNPLPIMRDFVDNVAIGDEVVVLGNAEGSGVINTILGHIAGISPTVIEVDAPFLPGNSGSPIIHLASQKVVGIATYHTVEKIDPATKRPHYQPIVRRYGYRIDTVRSWEPVNWNVFYAQAAEMAAIETLTRDLMFLLDDLSDGSVQRGKHTNPVLRSRIDGWLSSKSKYMSARDAATADQNFISFLKVACQSDITAAQSHFTYEYLRRQLADQQKERADIAEVFARLIQAAR